MHNHDPNSPVLSPDLHKKALIAEIKSANADLKAAIEAGRRGDRTALSRIDEANRRIAEAAGIDLADLPEFDPQELGR